MESLRQYRYRYKLRVLWFTNIALTILVVLFILAPWLTAIVQIGGYTGLTVDYNGLDLAWAVFTDFGYSTSPFFTSSSVYWMAIIPMVGCLILSLLGMGSLSSSIRSIKQSITLLFLESVSAIVALFTLILAYFSDLVNRLGYIDIGGGGTALRVVGWGFIAELVLLTALLVILEQFSKMKPQGS